MIKRYFIASALLLVVATLIAMWRENCLPGCTLRRVVLGLPVFLRTPYSPDSTERPEFYLIPFLINLGWSSVLSVVFWTIADTFGRWHERTKDGTFDPFRKS